MRSGLLRADVGRTAALATSGRGQAARRPAHGPPHLEPRPHEERLGLEGGEGNARRVPPAGEDEETRLPDGSELRVELVERLDLEPPGQEDEQPAPGPE